MPGIHEFRSSAIPDKLKSIEGEALMINRYLLAAAAFVAGNAPLPATVHAGAIANVSVCINLKAKVVGINFAQFAPGGTASGHSIHCMISNGSSYDRTEADQQGGYVRRHGCGAKKSSSSGGDLCASDDSYWVFNYQTHGAGPSFSGTVVSKWSDAAGVPHAQLTDYSGNASDHRLCDKPDPNCQDPQGFGYHNYRSWDGVGQVVS